MQTLGKYKVCEGLTKPQTRELIQFTNSDPLIIKSTKDKERFKNEERFNLWLKKNRKIYALINEDKKLLGIIWFGIKPIPKNIHFIESISAANFSITFAIRLYEKARGKNLSHKFIKEVWEKYSKTMDYLDNPSKGIWLETNINNFAAVTSYKKFGFIIVTKPNENGNILMLQK